MFPCCCNILHNKIVKEPSLDATQHLMHCVLLCWMWFPCDVLISKHVKKIAWMFEVTIGCIPSVRNNLVMLDMVAI